MQVDAVSGSFLLIDSNLFKKLNGFDEEFFIFGEDLDLCYRSKKIGKKVYYLPWVTLKHIGGFSRKKAPFLSIWQAHRAMWIFYRKNYATNHFFLVNILICFAIFLRAIMLEFKEFFLEFLKKYSK